MYLFCEGGEGIDDRRGMFSIFASKQAQWVKNFLCPGNVQRCKSEPKKRYWLNVRLMSQYLGLT